DARLDVFPHATDSDATVMQQRGVRSVQASHYGNPVSYTPEDRAAFAFDADPLTAWRVGAFGDPVGERLRIELAHPVTLDHLTVLQPVNGPRNRYVTRATLTFDGGRPLSVALGPESRELPGQEVRFPRHRCPTTWSPACWANMGSWCGRRPISRATCRRARRPRSTVTPRRRGSPTSARRRDSGSSSIRPNRSRSTASTFGSSPTAAT